MILLLNTYPGTYSIFLDSMARAIFDRMFSINGSLSCFPVVMSPVLSQDTQRVNALYRIIKDRVGVLSLECFHVPLFREEAERNRFFEFLIYSFYEAQCQIQ